MKTARFAALSLAFHAGLLFAGEENPFPDFAALPEAVVMPRGAAVSVAADGTFRVDGKPRHLLGTQIASRRLAGDFAPTPGYPETLKWVYEQPLSRENAQRLGFDTFAVFIPPDPWLQRFRPDYRSGGLTAADRVFFRETMANALPLLIDYTCFPWSFGLLAEGGVFAGAVPAEAINTRRAGGGGNHWVPYNIFHPEGRKLYLDYWRQGVDETAALPGQRLIYELFNEPGYNDPSDYNRRLFADYLSARHGTTQAMNRAWRSDYASFADAAAFKRQGENPGLFVDWTRFMESGMTELARLGAEAIKQKAPDGLVSFQILGRNNYRCLPQSNVNLYEISRYTDAIATPTTGGLSTRSAVAAPPPIAVEAPSDAGYAEGVLMRHFVRSIADGKPIHNPEAYPRFDRQGNRNVLWQDFLRGADATYLYMWAKRAYEWNPRGTAEGGRRMVERFTYQIANPYGFSPDTLAGFMDAKREIAAFADYFAPRDRGVPREVAVLLSFATGRLAPPTGYVLHNEVLHYAAGLELAHYPLDALVEEQLLAGRATEKGYKAIVAVGVRNTIPGTPDALARFVEGGGVLIAARETMPHDEYGRPSASPLFEGVRLRERPDAPFGELRFGAALPRAPRLPGRIPARNTREIVSAPGWETLASVEDAPAVVRRAFGRGHVYLVTPQLPDYATAAVTGSILETHGIRPALELERLPQGDLAVNVEAHVARRHGLTLAHLLNLDVYPKRIRAALPHAAEAAFDLLAREALPVEGGRVDLRLDANAYAIVGFGPAAELARRFGVRDAVTVGELDRRHRDAEVRLREELEQGGGGAFRFHPDPAMTVPLDLRPFANADFADRIADDGEGGWTDQGAEASLDGVPWEVVPLMGVPCDFIRPDENGGKGCMVLGSTSMRRKMPETVEGIPVGGKVRALYFFHTAAWSRPGMDVMRYRIRYADGHAAEIPIVAGRNIADWWFTASGALKNSIAWRNRDNRGFYIHEWRNPEPGRVVASLDIVSAGTRAVPIVIGITAERIADSVDEFNAAAGKATAWGNAAVDKDGERVVFRVGEKTTAWSGFTVHFPEALDLSNAQLGAGTLVFEQNGGEDRFGHHKGGQKLQVFLRSGQKTVGRKFRLPVPDGLPDTFEPVRLPLDRLVDNQVPERKVDGVGFQFMGDGGEAGVVLKNLRITVPAAER